MAQSINRLPEYVWYNRINWKWHHKELTPLLNVETRLQQLEQKVEALEQELGELRGLKEQLRQPPVMPPTRPLADSEGQREMVHAYKEIPPPTPRPATDWEHLIAKVWLPRIFIFVLLLGVLWGFTAAMDAGIITKPFRCILGIVAAGFMFWQGEAQSRLKRHALGQVLLGGSTALLMLSLFAAHMLYGYLPPSIAFVLFVLSIGLSVFNTIHRRSQALMMVTMIAGYLVPFLVDSATPNIWIFTGYEALFSIAMIVLSFRYSFRVSYYFAFGLLHVPLLIGSLYGDWHDGRNAIMLAALLQHITLFALSSFRQCSHKFDPSIVLFTSFGLTAAWMYGLFAIDDTLVYPSMIATLSFLYSAVAFWNMVKQKPAVVYAAIATFGWFLWLTFVLQAGGQSAAIVVEGVLALILGMKLNSKWQQITGGAAYLFGACSTLAHPIPDILSMETLAWLLLLGTIGGLYVFIRSFPEGDRYKPYRNSLIWIGSILLLIFFSQITYILTRASTLDMQHLILSGVWIVYAIAVVIFGVMARIKKVRLTGIAFLFVTLLKIIFADLPDVSMAVRAILFIGVGIVGIGISRLFYKRNG